MPITITITDPTPEQIAALFDSSAQRAIANERSYQEDNAAREAMQAERDAAKPRATRKKAEASALSAEDAALQAEIAADMAEAAPEPTGAKAVVDAGTGKPIEPTSAQERDAQANEDGEAVEMTFDEVKAKATKLAAADMNKLAEILGKYGAKKLSEVPEESLGDFAGDVIAALG